MYHRERSLERSFKQFIKRSLNQSLNRSLKPSHKRRLEQTSFRFFSKTYFLTRHKIKLSQKNANISKNDNPSFYDILMDLSYIIIITCIYDVVVHCWGVMGWFYFFIAKFWMCISDDLQTKTFQLLSVLYLFTTSMLNHCASLRMTKS